MPRVPAISPATGQPTSPHFIHTTDAHFVDNAGRTILLRGVNLSGADKAPVDAQSQQLDGFWEAGESGEESFVGRPLNLDDGSADVHLARLKGWGYNMLRYVVTWEALEHAGPGKYDYEFMEYTVRVLRKCKEYGFKVYLDPHQDIWSRFSGGSGAPYWTLPACGINPRNFTATQSAILHSEYPTPADANPADLPAMIWSTNYGRLASQTLFTLFFAGREFAPKCIIDGQNIQDYLQSHFIAAFAQLADRIRNAGDLLEECVIGWDSMNEPYEGFCGYADLNTVPTKQGSTLKKGSFPTPAQSLRLGVGRAQTVDNWKFTTMGPKRDGTVTIDPQGQKMWADPESEVGGVHPKWGWRRDPGWKLGTCIWALHGVWDIESGAVLIPDYFRYRADGQEVVFIDDFWRPHWQDFAMRMRESHPEAILFVAPPVFVPPPEISEDYLKGRCCLSTHYYDGLTLVTRHWNWFNADALGILRGKYSSNLPAVKIGERAIRKSLQEQLGYLKADAEILGAYPTIIGEIGIPYDMDGKKAYGYTDGGKYKGDFSNQQKALDASLNAADGPNALNYTIWNYCPDNSHAWGDGWNMEDLSVWSPDDLRPTTQYRMQKGDAFPSAGHNKLRRSATPSTGSSLSLSTIVPESPASDDTAVSSRMPAPNPFAHWDSAYDFLTDGTRAAKAFCRPFPTAVVGIPSDIQFDLSKAEFKLTVRVRPEDAPRREGLGLRTFVSLRHDEAELPTEIYVPLVHYASGKALSTPQREQSPASSHHGPLSKSFDTLTGVNSGHAVDPLRLLSDDPHLLALDVDISAGRWTLEGQTLKWWYPVPSSGQAREYTITVRRAGGAIKTAEEQASACSLWGMLSSCFGWCCTVM
ncbi:glycoside hydrolase [Trametes versicolor FP-101664 SS1]|uniref:glycoside hydrolase n=1 Tax=Trametes versicolor (strain FP-101664) TaxID=717944 RepID=UPI0004624547|nr:glycoside hydrolase [Trametes versicolor FP-101664 SS1]EIW61009.1 glycoside hydrolase [Trametes versicolor FP-101664 SS1]